VVRDDHYHEVVTGTDGDGIRQGHTGAADGSERPGSSGGLLLECFLPAGIELDIRPASHRRAWMDATDAAFAYRCIPLSIANAHGWEIRSPVSFEAEWNGDDAPSGVRLESDADLFGFAAGHFGYGILTFRPGAIFRTPPGYNLAVSGPPNSPKDGIYALSAIVETDWMPYTFSMNWKFTRAGHRIRFDTGEPYCFICPVARNSAAEFEPVMRALTEDPEMEANYWRASHWREFSKHVKELKGVQLEEHRFQKWYQRGQKPDGSPGAADHQTLVKVKPFASSPEESAEP
jgi:hypothetical protein